MTTYLILLFTVLPALELMVLIEIGSAIGASTTILIILMTGVSGAALARLQGFAILSQIQNSLNEGVLPTDAMLDGVLILAGGLLLLTPGFITDGLGLLLLIPLSRQLVRHWVKRSFQSGFTARYTSSRGSRREEDRIRPPNVQDADFTDLN